MKTEWVADEPETYEPDTLYIIGGREYPYWAALACPKRQCNHVIHLPISTNQLRPLWKWKEHADGTITLSPSVHKTGDSACPGRCHFFVREGRVVFV